MNDNRIAVKNVTYSQFTKNEFIKLIEDNYTEVDSNNIIVNITTTTMTDGTVMQGFAFDRTLK